MMRQKRQAGLEAMIVVNEVCEKKVSREMRGSEIRFFMRVLSL